MKLPKYIVRYATTVTPLSKCIAAFLFLVLPFTGFWLGTKYQRIIDSHELDISQYIWKSAKKEAPVAQTLGEFIGILPCADCEGIETKLTLHTNAQSSPSSYILTETYLGAEDKQFTYTGNWKLQIGGKRDKTAEIYVVHIEDENTTRSFLKINDTELELLDQNQNIITSKENYSLKRVGY